VKRGNSIGGRSNHRTVDREVDVNAAAATSYSKFDLPSLVEVAGGGGGNRIVVAGFLKAHVNAIVSNLPAISVRRRGTRWYSLARTGTRWFVPPVSYSCPTEEGHFGPVFVVQERVIEGAPSGTYIWAGPDDCRTDRLAIRYRSFDGLDLQHPINHTGISRNGSH
jgi:hypothetical protein